MNGKLNGFSPSTVVFKKPLLGTHCRTATLKNSIEIEPRTAVLEPLGVRVGISSDMLYIGVVPMDFAMHISLCVSDTRRRLAAAAAAAADRILWIPSPEMED